MMSAIDSAIDSAVLQPEVHSEVQFVVGRTRVVNCIRGLNGKPRVDLVNGYQSWSLNKGS